MSEWTEVGFVEEDGTAVVVYRRGCVVRVETCVPGEGIVADLGPSALDDLRELLDRAAMPGQAEP